MDVEGKFDDGWRGFEDLSICRIKIPPVTRSLALISSVFKANVLWWRVLISRESVSIFSKWRHERFIALVFAVRAERVKHSEFVVSVLCILVLHTVIFILWI